MSDKTEKLSEYISGGGGRGLGLLDKLKSMLGFSAGFWPWDHIRVGKGCGKLVGHSPTLVCCKVRYQTGNSVNTLWLIV